MADMIRVQLVSHHEHDDPVADMCAAAAYAIRGTVHGTTQYTPAQLVFQKDLILRTKMQTNMELVRQRRQKAIEQNNTRENRRRIKHTYKAGDKILVLPNAMDPKMQLNRGPYRVISYDASSGTVRIQRNNYEEPLNIRRIRPYFGK